MLAEERHRVPPAIGVMPGIESQRRDIQIGQSQIFLNLGLGAHMGFGVGMEHRLHAEFVSHDRRHPFHPFDQSSEVRFIEVGRG